MNYIYYSIDRFEDIYAVCENLETGKMENILIKDIPLNAKTGDIIKFDGKTYTIDDEKTLEQKEKIQNMVKNLFKK